MTSKRILCVFFGEDPYFYMETVGKLRQHGYDIVDEKLSAPVDLVIQYGLSISDHCPEMGLACLENLKGLFGGTPCIVVSEPRPEPVLQRIKAAGAEYFEHNEWNDDPKALVGFVEEYLWVN